MSRPSWVSGPAPPGGIVMRPWPRPNVAHVMCAALLVAWMVWAPPSPDLAAQVYRLQEFAAHGFSLWDNNWYGGHYLPDYSLAFPPIASVLGLRGAGIAAVALSTLIFERLARARFGSRAAAATALFAIGAAGDLYIGRITFALGVTLGLAAVLAAVHGRGRLTVLASLGCAAASPVAAVFLALAATADLIATRSVRRALALAAPALLLTLVLTVLFPEGGVETFGTLSFLAAAAAAVLPLVLLPPEERLLRVGAALYLLLVVAAFVIPSPMGSNAQRLGVLFAAPILAGAVRLEDVRRLPERARLRGRRVSAGQARAVVVVAIVGLVAWQVNGPLAQSLQASSDPSTQSAYYAPVVRFLERASRGAPMRIEAVFTATHWDATYLATRFALARGWERQLDTKYDALFYEPRLTAAEYRTWLLSLAVRYVALPDAPLDPSSVAEAALIRHGLPYLRQVFASAHWRVYAVLGAEPLVSGPARLRRLDATGFELAIRRAGTVTVRVRYTPYWAMSGDGCVSEAPDGWTLVTATRAETVTVAARFSLSQALDPDPRCSGPVNARLNV